MVEKKITSNKKEEGERKLDCGQGCDFNSWKSFTQMSGIMLPDVEIDGIPLVDITQALHNSLRHQDYEEIDSLEFNRRDPRYGKLLEALREGKEVKKYSLN